VNLETISLGRLALAFLPMAAVVLIMAYWRCGVRRAFYATGRMLLQLLLIGYVLVFIFETESGLLISGVLAVMVVAASWVALNTSSSKKTTLFPASLVSVFTGGGIVMLVVTQGVLELDPWYAPSTVIPLAGMIFAASMTNISLAVERLESELKNAIAYPTARDVAFRTSMIPVINSFFAVGLISLPGMMTGQILSGVSPLIAARYQIMVMCMIFGAAGISTACFLLLTRQSGAFRHLETAAAREPGTSPGQS
jgi:putative ABC transport system permease protein